MTTTILPHNATNATSPPITVLIVGGAYQGKTALARRLYPTMERVEQLHQVVRQTLANSNVSLVSWDTLFQPLLCTLRGKCVICDEVGCGIVPLDPQDEQWREAVGRLCCALAAEADVVIRVVAGLPQYLKGAPAPWSRNASRNESENESGNNNGNAPVARPEDTP